MDFLYVVCSSLLFGIVPSVQEFAILKGADAMTIMTYVSWIAMLFSLTDCFLKKVDLRVSIKELLTLFIAEACGLFMTDFLLDCSYTFIPVGLTTSIHFSYPTIICVFNRIFFQEELTKNRITAIGLSAIGLVLLAGNLQGNKIGLLTAFSSACCYALYLLLMDKSCIRQMSEDKRIFYVSLFAPFLCHVINRISNRKIPVRTDYLFILLIAGLMLFLGDLFLSIGVKKMGSTKASLLNTLEPVTSLLVSSLLFQYQLSFLSLAGCGLIILSLIPIIKEKK